MQTKHLRGVSSHLNFLQNNSHFGALVSLNIRILHPAHFTTLSCAIFSGIAANERGHTLRFRKGNGHFSSLEVRRVVWVDYG